MIGFVSPDHMRETLTCGQIARWNQFLDQVPVGERRNDMRNAQLIAHVRASSGQRFVRASDHLMEFYPRAVEEVPILEKLRAGLAACRSNTQ